MSTSLTPRLSHYLSPFSRCTLIDTYIVTQKESSNYSSAKEHLTALIKSQPDPDAKQLRDKKNHSFL